ncbi:MAG: helix-turn-helix domain-containing protein [Kangiellaceae bacterium]|nr:helix-turn-helix domain-containing protein [Kangiellaceae bacterium]
MTSCLDLLGSNLKKSRKERFPKDTVNAFAIRCEIGLSTYKKMEKGDLSVSINYYYMAAKVLENTERFSKLFELDEDWFNE